MAKNRQIFPKCNHEDEYTINWKLFNFLSKFSKNLEIKENITLHKKHQHKRKFYPKSRSHNENPAGDRILGIGFSVVEIRKY